MVHMLHEKSVIFYISNIILIYSIVYNSNIDSYISFLKIVILH